MNSEMANERVVYGTQELKMRRSNVRNFKGIRMSKGVKRRGGVFSSYRCRDYDSVVIRRIVKIELRVYFRSPRITRILKIFQID